MRGGDDGVSMLNEWADSESEERMKKEASHALMYQKKDFALAPRSFVKQSVYNKCVVSCFCFDVFLLSLDVFDIEIWGGEGGREREITVHRTSHDFVFVHRFQLPIHFCARTTCYISGFFLPTFLFFYSHCSQLILLFSLCFLSLNSSRNAASNWHDA